MGDLTDKHYAQTLWDTALKHQRNPVVAQRLAQLEAAVKLVEEENLIALAQRSKDEAEQWWAPAGGFNRGVLNTIVGSTGTGKSIWGERMLKQYHKELQQENSSSSKPRRAHGK